MVFPCSGTLQLVVTISRFLSSANIDEYDHDLCVWLLRGTQGHMIRHITVTKVCDVRIVPESRSPRISNLDSIIELIKFDKKYLRSEENCSGVQKTHIWQLETLT